MKNNFEYLEKFIDRYDKFVISTHESPDADGLGAELAFNELLKNLNKQTLIINSDETPDTLLFMDFDHEIKILDRNFVMPADISDYAQFVLDTHDYDNIGAAHYRLKEKVKDIFIIDHHEGIAENPCAAFIDSQASSACEIIYRIVSHYNKQLNFKSAQALYTGIMFDTGSFRYPKTTAETYDIAAHCLRQNANPFKIYEQLYENNTLSSFELRSNIVSTMEVFYGGKLIAMKLTPEMLKTSGASFSEGEPTINLPLTVKGVVASLLIKQSPEGPVKVSMRTKGDCDVAEIAIKNGGGGHKNAAGYKSKLSFDETYKKAIQDLKKFFL